MTCTKSNGTVSPMRHSTQCHAISWKNTDQSWERLYC